ncbi:uncharacterized protein BT62DRAFT_455509 [Guyanagaster necrorhizus]|uniref:Uncharacterized protein n=1 Tax=Guyanagaster necrorhizus TaxID=856835 RepID=A0A9P8ANM4_9AGAR|nr:uncharacterized protein BT62DRAFT_455509 [Guyanagaster necrorhizus MCA 3950]KAG7442070.1 hypothetical protein BT62DRAFT_455509 [Guyanagaster necrorhizus MCA 3950]
MSENEIDSYFVVRRDITCLSSLLAALEHWRYTSPEFDYRPRPRLTDTDQRRMFYTALADVSSTVDRSVAVTGSVTADQRIRLVVSVSKPVIDESAATQSDASSESTLVEAMDVNKEDAVPQQNPVPHFEPLSINRFLSPLLESKLESAYPLLERTLKHHPNEFLQIILASDAIFPRDRKGFRGIFKKWQADHPIDRLLLPEGGIIRDIGEAQAERIEKTIPGVRVRDTGRVIVTNANLPKWINMMGKILCITVKRLKDCNQSCDEQTSTGMSCISIMSIISEVFSATNFIPVFAASSMAPALASCYTYTQSIDMNDIAAHQSYPIPLCLHTLVMNYLNQICSYRGSALVLYMIHDWYTRRLPDPKLEVYYLTTDDSTLEMHDVSLDRALRLFILVDITERWYRRRRRWLQAQKVTGSVHPEAALICLQLATTTQEQVDRLQAQHHFSDDAAQLLSQLDNCIGLSRKMCWCCNKLWSLQARKTKETTDPRYFHGHVLPWIPPAYGVSLKALKRMRLDLIEILRETVNSLKVEDLT